MNRVHIAVSCFVNEGEVLSFAKQIENQTVNNRITLHIVINKSSSDIKKEWLINEVSKLCIHTSFHYPDANLGYLHGGLLGLDSCDRKTDNDWYVVSNTDLQFQDTTFFETLLEMRVEANTVVIAPDVVLQTTGRHQNPYMISRPSKKSMLIRKICFSNYVLYRLYLAAARIKQSFSSTTKCMIDKSMNIYAAHGCFLCMRQSVLNDLDHYSAGLFMYGEELLLAEVVNMQNKKVLYYPDLKILHMHRVITEREANRKKQKWFNQSINLLVNRFFI